MGDLVAAIPAPLNVLSGFGAPTVAEFAAIGDRRSAFGSSLAQAAYDVVRRAAGKLLSAGPYGPLERELDYGELNRLLVCGR